MTTNVVVTRQVNSAINGIDLLLLIDNSSSMADKQSTLAEAVPQLLTQLVQPACVDENGKQIGTLRAPLGGTCSQGSTEFNPVNNIHIGIVTSSLGDHGANSLCMPGRKTTYVDSNNQPINQPNDVNDKGYLVGKLARYDGSQSATAAHVKVDSQGFLAWGDDSKPGMTTDDLTAATKTFKNMVATTREMGCGLEAQLEGWFRFLVDPVPPATVAVVGQSAERQGVDDALLAQRAAFLRPDSLVAILMLTDENDCSLRDTDFGYVAANTGSSIKTGSPKCATDPNDPCCFSCTTNSTPSGCEACPSGAGAATDDSQYQVNIRCWHQKRRFGYEFMYPTSRYVTALSKPFLCPDQSFGDMDCDCTYARSIHAGCDAGSRKLPNPLYGSVVGTDSSGNPVNSANAKAIPRTDNSLIFLAGIVGVPWQDIGYKDDSGNLTYIPVTDVAWSDTPAGTKNPPKNPNKDGKGIWAQIYGDDNANIVPGDPHMIESIVPRDGISSNDEFVGHDWTTAYVDLEYACIYPLPKSRACECDPTNTTEYNSCKYQKPNDCCDLTFTVDGHGDKQASPVSYNKPLCDGNTQVKAKAYPGQREIQVLKTYATDGEYVTTKGNSIVASICPADLTSDSGSAGYGYNPAVAALVNRLKEKLKGSCLPRQLAVSKETGQVPCNVVEAIGSSVVENSGKGSCAEYCTSQGRGGAVSSQMQSAVIDSMKQSGLCDKEGGIACSNICMCLLNQAQGDQLSQCQSVDEAQAASLSPGYCYVDPDNGIGADKLVSKCPDSQRRILRYVGNNPTGGTTVPLSGAWVYTACQGSAIDQTQ